MYAFENDESADAGNSNVKRLRTGGNTFPAQAFDLSISIISSLKRGIVTPEITRALIAAHPYQLKQPDINKVLPLHYACGAGGRMQSFEVIKILVDVYPAAVEIQETYNRTPLHLALEMGVSIEIINLLLKAFPAAVEMKDEYGRTPLYLAAQKRATDSK